MVVEFIGWGRKRGCFKLVACPVANGDLPWLTVRVIQQCSWFQSFEIDPFVGIDTVARLLVDVECSGFTDGRVAVSESGEVLGFDGEEDRE